MNNAQEAQIEMPKYQSHKQVWALKIKEIKSPEVSGDEFLDGKMIIVPEESGYAPFVVDRDYIRKHEPQVGGYYVVYKGGYKSWSPADAFEEGYVAV